MAERAPWWDAVRRRLPEFVSAGLLWGVLYFATGAEAAPGGHLFGLGVTFVVAVILGGLCPLVGLPPLVGMLVAGFAMRNIPVINVAQDIRPEWARFLRSLALVVILLRAGVGFDLAALIRLSGACLRLAVIPNVVEVLTVSGCLVGFLQFPFEWAIMTGFVLSAVSPAVVVPSLLHLQDQGYGTRKGIPTLVLAAASFDDVVAISGFGVCLSIVFSTGNPVVTGIMGPVELLVGAVVGVAVGVALVALLPMHYTSHGRIRGAVLILAGLFVLLGGKAIDFGGGGALSIIVIGLTAASLWRRPHAVWWCRRCLTHPDILADLDSGAELPPRAGGEGAELPTGGGDDGSDDGDDDDERARAVATLAAGSTAAPAMLAEGSTAGQVDVHEPGRHAERGARDGPRAGGAHRADGAGSVGSAGSEDGAGTPAPGAPGAGDDDGSVDSSIPSPKGGITSRESFPVITGLHHEELEGAVDRVSEVLKHTWHWLQPMLFCLIGAEVDITRVNAEVVGLGVAAICIGLLARCLAVLLAASGAGLLMRERVFVALAWLPKATVQAAIGSLALDTAVETQAGDVAEERGLVTLTLAVLAIMLTAPVGAAAIAWSGPRMLERAGDRCEDGGATGAAAAAAGTASTAAGTAAAAAGGDGDIEMARV